MKKTDIAIIENPIRQIINSDKITKAAIDNLASIFVEAALEIDNCDKLLVQGTALNMLTKAICDKLRERLTFTDLDIYKGVKIENSSTPSKLNFSQDNIYADLEAKLKDRKEQLSTQYKQFIKWRERNPMKKVSEFIGLVDESGAQVPICEKISGGSACVKLTFPNK